MAPGWQRGHTGQMWHWALGQRKRPELTVGVSCPSPQGSVSAASQRRLHLGGLVPDPTGDQSLQVPLVLHNPPWPICHLHLQNLPPKSSKPVCMAPCTPHQLRAAHPKLMCRCLVILNAGSGSKAAWGSTLLASSGAGPGALPTLVPIPLNFELVVLPVGFLQHYASRLFLAPRSCGPLRPAHAWPALGSEGTG